MRRVKFRADNLRISEDDDVELWTPFFVAKETRQTIPPPLSVIAFVTILTRSFVELVKVSMVSCKAERTNSLEIPDSSIFDMVKILSIKIDIKLV